MAPAFTGIVALGTTADCVTTGLNIPITTGTKAIVLVSATASGITLINSVVGYASTGVGFA